MAAPSAWSVPQLTYGITPPKVSMAEPRRRSVAAAQSERIRSLPIDALVVYDLQDESSRTDVERPFPFMRAIDPLDYALDYLEVPQPKVVYRSVSGHDAASLGAWLERLRSAGGATVLVGAPSRSQSVSLRLSDAYAVHEARSPGLPLGGVLIAERHAARGNEDQRCLRKVERGCSFFISQAVYSVIASKNLLSDLVYRCQDEGREVPPILLTLTPCGSKKTLDFLAWLGVEVPRWLQNELAHAKDILSTSIETSVAAFEELHDFAAQKGIRLGCNVESVSVRRAEIDASVELVERVAKILGR